METCFDNIVSLREYCEPIDPVSEIYLDDIGIGKTEIENIVGKNYSGVKQLINSTVAMSVKEITTEIYGFFSGKIKTHSAIETGITGVPDESYTIVAGGGYRGIRLNLHNGANYLNFQLSALSLFLDFTGDVDVLVYDLDQNKLLETIVVAAVAGEIIEIYPASLYKSSLKPLNLWIGYDSTGIDSYKTLTRSSVCCGNYGRNTEYLKSYGALVTGDFIESNITTLQDTAGIGVRYSIWCDPTSWMCTYSRMLALPIAYKTAAELYRRGLMVSPNSRTNNVVTLNSDLLQKNFDWHEGKYRDAMQRILTNIHLPKSTACFYCNSPSRHAIVLP